MRAQASIETPGGRVEAGTGYANVVVNASISRATSGFHYSIPRHLGVRRGQLVLVPFGPRRVQAVVLDVLDSSDVSGVKDVLAIVDPEPILSPAQIDVARWICAHYHSTLMEAIQLMLPPGQSLRPYSTVEIGAGTSSAGPLSPKQFAVMEAIKNTGQIRMDRLKATTKSTGVDRAVTQLVQRGVLVRRWELEKPKVGPKTDQYVRLALDASDPECLSEGLKSAPKQAAVMEYLRASASEVSLSQIYRDTGCTSQTVGALERKGLIVVESRGVWRDPLAHHKARRTAPPVLTTEQERVWQTIRTALDGPIPHVFLLQGVTGSGKTEIYMRALERTLRAGKQAIVMVPEIALTPQAVHRFSSRFPGVIAVLHSGLTLGQQYDEWRRIRDGELKVVIGSRSAVFAPARDLGLIVVDEEHEWAYKQEASPRYSGRDVAIRLGEFAKATVILGSATPDIVTFQRALDGEYVPLSLPERVAPGAEPTEDAPVVSVRGATEASPSFLPPVHVVDLRQELRAGNRGIFSRALSEAIILSLSLREQVILFLNRRGTSTFVMCRDCGYVLRCRRCEASLVYHSDDDDLVCHLCAERTVAPEGCPQCWGSRIRYFGIGTQKVEEETKRLFPAARVLRWDRDTTKQRGSHERILHSFANREADILIGTQMIAKGLDLPKVTLVGVVSADTALHLPDYRAAERTFQLLTQVAGRAGRGQLGGRVIVQTYSPEHYCIRAASRHDYHAFYRQEIEFRRENGYPPFGQLIKLVYTSSNEARCQTEAERLSKMLVQQIELQGLPATDIVGPAPSYSRRVRGKYRWQLLIRGVKSAEALDGIAIPLGWSVDVDPYTTL